MTSGIEPTTISGRRSTTTKMEKAVANYIADCVYTVGNV